MPAKNKEPTKAKAKSKAKPKAEALPSGRPTNYKPEYDTQVEKLCKLGATDKEIADFFDVSEQTVNTWKHKHPTFLESIKNGKVIADIMVSESLFKKATGYEQDNVKIFQFQGEPVVVPYTEKYQPDTTAMIFWLKNRQPGKWRDRQEVEHSGELKMPAIIITK